MKWFLYILAGYSVACLLGGCANFKTKQSDTSITDTNGITTRTIITEAKATTFIASSSSLASFKATQTDKSQGASVGSLNQNAEVSTNMLEAAGTIVGSALKSLAK